jgi:hypothetical protein
MLLMNKPQNTTINRTGPEMLEELRVLNAHLATPGLTGDAIGPLQAKRDELHTQFSKAADYALALSQETGVTFLNPLEEVETQDALGTEQPAPEKIDIWKLLTPEQRAKAKREITRLAGEFGRDKTEFDLIMSKIVDQDGNEIAPVLKVIHTATKGIDLGNNPNKDYDPKRNWGNSVAETKRLNLSGITLEDAAALAAVNPEINEWVWLTGEAKRADRRSAPVAYVYESQTGRGMRDRQIDYRYVAFRPAVVIA